MASEIEDTHAGLVELEELEVTEIDEALLRELLEEQEEVDAEVECLVESVKNDNKKEEEDQKQKISCSDQQHEGCNNVEFEWINNMMEMENDEVVLNWYPGDMVGMMVDFGYVNAEFCSQICEGLISNEVQVLISSEDVREIMQRDSDLSPSID